MPSILFYFEVHQPRRLLPGHKMKIKEVKKLEDFDRFVFDDRKNKEITHKVANKCYKPMNSLLLELLDTYNGKRGFKFSFSITGTLLEQLDKYERDALELFKQMAKHKNVEVLAETFYHSLSSLWGYGTEREEFKDQVKEHIQALKDYLGIRRGEIKVFRNTELLYNNSIAKTAEEMGFHGILMEGIEHVMQGRSPNFIYKAHNSDIRVLARNYKLSDDIAYRFSARWFEEWPLTADKYAAWLSATPGDVINLFMDYETFGEHQWEDTGIFEFMRHLPGEVLNYPQLEFERISDAIQKYSPIGEIYVDDLYTISWADMERDTSAWLGNDMQYFTFKELEKLSDKLKVLKNKDKKAYKKAVKIWRYLQTSDHLYYICTKSWSDGDVHKYFSPYGTPHESFEAMLKAISRLSKLIDEEINKKDVKEVIRWLRLR